MEVYVFVDLCIEFQTLKKSIDSTVALDDLILTEDAGVLFAIGRIIEGTYLS